MTTEARAPSRRPGHTVLDVLRSVFTDLRSRARALSVFSDSGQLSQGRQMGRNENSHVHDGPSIDRVRACGAPKMAFSSPCSEPPRAFQAASGAWRLPRGRLTHLCCPAMTDCVPPLAQGGCWWLIMRHDRPIYGRTNALVALPIIVFIIRVPLRAGKARQPARPLLKRIQG